MKGDGEGNGELNVDDGNAALHVILLRGSVDPSKNL